MDSDLKTYDIYLTGRIEYESVQPVIERIHQLNTKSKPCAINLYINSEGGSVYAGNALIDAIVSSNKQIKTIGTGIVGSMAVYILAVGNIVTCTPNTTFIIHNIFSENSGTVSECLVNVKQLSFLNKNLINILTKQRKVDHNLIKQKMKLNVDWYLNASKAKQIGLIDYF